MRIELRPLRDAAAEPFVRAGKVAYHFARGKLSHDPLYFGVLRQGLVPSNSRVLDLGCGQGIMLSLLAVAEQSVLGWPPYWPRAPQQLQLAGMDLRQREVDRARRALGDRAQVWQSDLALTDYPEADVLFLFDVLHYLPARAQEEVLWRAADALSGGGLLLVREASAGTGLSFTVTRAAERFNALARGETRQRFRYRSSAEWTDLLGHYGFKVSTHAMDEGTPFANVLLVARKR